MEYWPGSKKKEQERGYGHRDVIAGLEKEVAKVWPRRVLFSSSMMQIDSRRMNEEFSGTSDSTRKTCRI